MKDSVPQKLSLVLFLNELVFLDEPTAQSSVTSSEVLTQYVNSVEQPFACFVPELISILSKTVN